MKLQVALLALLAVGGAGIQAAPDATNSASTNRILMVDRSSMAVDGGKATLTIGALERVDGVYLGNYKMNVSPYFFKNEKGRLAIVVSDETMDRINHGKAASVIGTATTSGKGGISRHVDAVATPIDINRGTLNVRFKVGNRKMIFEPAYHFTERRTAAVLAQTTETNLVSHLQRGAHVSQDEGLEVAATRP